jgi:hypothetical protein
MDEHMPPAADGDEGAVDFSDEELALPPDSPFPEPEYLRPPPWWLVYMVKPDGVGSLPIITDVVEAIDRGRTRAIPRIKARQLLEKGKVRLGTIVKPLPPPKAEREKEKKERQRERETEKVLALKRVSDEERAEALFQERWEREQITSRKGETLRALHRAQVFSMVAEGKTFRTCARILQMPAAEVATLFQEEAQRQIDHEQQRAEFNRLVEDTRLNMAAKAIAPQVKRGDLRAVRQWVLISESRRKLLGLDLTKTVSLAEEERGSLAQLDDRQIVEEITKMLGISVEGLVRIAESAVKEQQGGQIMADLLPVLEGSVEE